MEFPVSLVRLTDGARHVNKRRRLHDLIAKAVDRSDTLTNVINQRNIGLKLGKLSGQSDGNLVTSKRLEGRTGRSCTGDQGSLIEIKVGKVINGTLDHCALGKTGVQGIQTSLLDQIATHAGMEDQITFGNRSGLGGDRKSRLRLGNGVHAVR